MSLLCSFALTAAEASFLRWASSKGVMADGVQVAKAVASGKGYGLRANRALAEGQTLVSVSAAAWTAFSAEACRANLRQQNEPLFASLAAVAHRLLPNSPRQADQFVDSLSMSLAAAYSPGPYWQLLRDNTYPFNSGTWPHPLVLHSSLLERSLGPVTSAGGVSTTATAIAKRKRFYDYAAKVLSAGVGQEAAMAAVAADAAILHEGSVIEAQIKAGVGLVLSRGISGLGNPLTMVPFLDFANHASTNSNNGPCSFESTHKWYADSNALHSYDQSTRSFSLIATRDIDVGEDICISYGNGRSTESFMALYGFPGVPDILDSQDSQHKIDKAGESDLDWSNSSCIDAKQEKEQCLNVILPYYLAVLNENDNISIVVETLAGDISKVLYSLKELGATRPSKLPDSSLDLHSILTSLCHDYGNKLKRSLGEERVEDSLLKLSIEPGHDKTASLIPWIRLMHLLLLQSHQSQLPVTMRSLKKCLRLINQSLDKQLPMGLTLVKLPDYPSISDVDDSSAINKLRTLLLLVVDRNSWYGSSRSLCKEDDRYSDASSGGEDWFRSCDVALFLQHTPLVIMKHICEVLEEYINRADDVR